MLVNKIATQEFPVTSAALSLTGRHIDGPTLLSRTDSSAGFTRVAAQGRNLVAYRTQFGAGVSAMGGTGTTKVDGSELRDERVQIDDPGLPPRGRALC